MIYVVNVIKQNTEHTSSNVKVFKEHNLAKKYAEHEIELYQEEFKDADVERTNNDIFYLISFDADTQITISIFSTEICESL